MLLQVNYQYPFTDWSVFHVFHGFYNELIKSSDGIDYTYIDSGKHYDGNPSSYYSPHIMVIKNTENQKYITISYWDNAVELSYNVHGWDNNKRVQLITSSGVFNDLNHEPFSYISYSKIFDEFSLGAKPMELKEKNELFFKGYLYGYRYELSKLNLIDITNQKVFPEKKYFDELTNNKICLSLNGVGEICNRDIEILSARSVLLRPKLKQKFYNELIPDYHYVSFEESQNPKEQCEIILNKFNEIKNNEEFLKFVSENGFLWYKQNGTINSNIELLKKIVNINLLR